MGATAWFLIFGLLGTAGAQHAEPGTAAGQLSAEELQVVMAALDATALREARKFVRRKDRESADAVTPDATLAACAGGGRSFCIPDTASASIKRQLGEASPALADRFVTRIATAVAVPQLPGRIAVVPAGALPSFGPAPPGGWWEEFRQRFGGAALVQFSAPAIAGDEAAAYVVFGCGGLCGKSWLVTLERRGAEFRVRKAVLLTMS